MKFSLFSLLSSFLVWFFLGFSSLLVALSLLDSFVTSLPFVFCWASQFHYWVFPVIAGLVTSNSVCMTLTSIHCQELMKSVIAETSSTFCGWISSFSCSLICSLYNLVIRFSTLGWLESKCGKVLILLWKCLSSESAWFDVEKSFIYRPEKRWLGDKDGTNTPSLLCFSAHNLSVNKLQLERCPVNGTNPLSLLEGTWMDCWSL